jgi:hypothetical protein
MESFRDHRSGEGILLAMPGTWIAQQDDQEGPGKTLQLCLERDLQELPHPIPALH